MDILRLDKYKFFLFKPFFLNLNKKGLNYSTYIFCFLHRITSWKRLSIFWGIWAGIYKFFTQNICLLIFNFHFWKRTERDRLAYRITRFFNLRISSCLLIQRVPCNILVLHLSRSSGIQRTNTFFKTCFFWKRAFQSIDFVVLDCLSFRATL